MKLTAKHVTDLCTGALFLACAIDHQICLDWAERAITYSRDTGKSAELLTVDEMTQDDLIATIGFVNSGLPLTELRPVGDEFQRSIQLLEATLGKRVAGIIPLAGANINAMVPVVTALQTGLPIIDADPMGRVFPLFNHTVFAMDGLTAGPISATGGTGESTVIHVTDPARAERLTRVLAAEYGGWAATASYPMSTEQVAKHAILGTISRMLVIGNILNSTETIARKRWHLLNDVGVTKIISTRVIELERLSRPSSPDQPDRPSSVTLREEDNGRIVRLEIQNELLMVMVDGAVEAVVPDIITMLNPEDYSVASLEDLWVGNRIDIATLPASPQWYTDAGLQLVGPKALQVIIGKRVRKTS